jgi:hypothetical protein
MMFLGRVFWAICTMGIAVTRNLLFWYPQEWASRNDTSGMVFFKIVLTCGLP